MDLIDRLPGPIVVLGGAGFIGSNLVRRLVTGGRDDVTVIDITRPAYRARALAGSTFIEPCDSRMVVEDAGTVFHLAADMGGVGYFHSSADLGAAMRNTRITLNALDACVEGNVRCVFYAASACAYPIELMQPGMEPLAEHQVGYGTPDALYGAEKLHGLRLCSKIPAARVGILDTVYGPLQEHEGRRMKFPAAVATKAIRSARTGEPLELWGDGNQLRSYLFIDDAIDRILAIAGTDGYWGPVNIASAGTISCREAAEVCLAHVGADVPIVTNPSQPSGVLARECSTAKYRTHYGAANDRTYPEGFGAFIDWLQEVI